ncbi:MAG TPA: helix-turn-helix domain-containing protein [Candidatus Acidoferrales bacterium]|nr:helix-turn-helix domain-containing protein [Candidatus Acidoferrales bacterium]
MKAQPTRSDRRMVRNREALLNAAEKLIAEKGLERLTIDEITETADLAKGTFYNYFNDKNEAARELALGIRRDLAAEVGVAQAGIEDPAGRLTIGICVFLRTAVTAPTRAAVVAQMYSQWLRPEAAGNLRLRKDLEDGYRAGRFSTAELPVAVMMTVGAVQAGILRALELSEESAVRKLAISLCGLALRALGVKWNEAQAISAKSAARVFGHNSKGTAR